MNGKGELLGGVSFGGVGMPVTTTSSKVRGVGDLNLCCPSGTGANCRCCSLSLGAKIGWFRG